MGSSPTGGTIPQAHRRSDLSRQRRPQRRARRAGPPFPINLIFNVRAFYVAFIVVIIASMAAVGLGGVAGTGRQRPGETQQ